MSFWLFETLAGGGGVDKIAKMSPIFIFAIDRSIIQNVDVTRQTFETIETIKYFLGVILQQK